MRKIKALVYRNRRPEDDPFVIQTSLKTMKEVFEQSTGMPLTEQALRQQIATSDTLTIVERDEKPIGYYSYTIYAPGRMYFSAMVLEPHAQGRGFGKRIARHIEAEVAARGVRLIEGHAQTANTRAIVFWLKQGYRITGMPMRGMLALEKTVAPKARPHRN